MGGGGPLGPQIDTGELDLIGKLLRSFHIYFTKYRIPKTFKGSLQSNLAQSKGSVTLSGVEIGILMNDIERECIKLININYGLGVDKIAQGNYERRLKV